MVGTGSEMNAGAVITNPHTHQKIGQSVGAYTNATHATSGGSGIGGAQKSMREHCPEAEWKQGKLVNSGATAWAKSVMGK